jgi:hypothetical protein
VIYDPTILKRQRSQSGTRPMSESGYQLWVPDWIACIVTAIVVNSSGVLAASKLHDEVEDAHRYTQRILEDLYDDRPTVEAILVAKKRLATAP